MRISNWNNQADELEKLGDKILKLKRQKPASEREERTN